MARSPRGRGAGAGRPGGRRGRIRGNPLYLRVKVFDPDRLFGALAHRLGWFFTRSFLAASAFLIVLALGVGVAHRGEFVQDLVRLLRPQVLLFAWLTVFAVTILHESAVAAIFSAS